MLGLRRRPGRLALAVFRVPLPLYRAGWGWLLGRTFLLLVHAGRKTGQPHAMTAMVLRYDAATHEAVICSGWGPTTDWIRNIRARPALEVQIGRESFTPQQRFLSEDESFDVCLEFCLRHPARLRIVRPVFGWDLRSEKRDQGVRPDPPLRGVPARTGIGTASLALMPTHRTRAVQDVGPLGERRCTVIRQVREDLFLYLTCPATSMLGGKGDEQPCTLCI